MPVMSSTNLYHVAQIILQIWSCYQSLVTLTFFIREVIITSMLWGFEQKNQFFDDGWFWFMSNNESNHRFHLATLHKRNNHCVKSVQIRSFFWSVFSRIQPEYKNSVFGYFSSSVVFGQISKLCTSFLNLPQSLSTFNFSKFSTFSKF